MFSRLGSVFSASTRFRKAPSFVLRQNPLWSLRGARFFSETTVKPQKPGNDVQSQESAKKKFWKRPKKHWRRNRDDHTDPKECNAFGTAENYNFSELQRLFKSRKEQIWEYEGGTILCRLTEHGYVFYFEGSVVCWGLSQQQYARLLEEVKPFELNRIPELQEESMDYFEVSGEDEHTHTMLKDDALFIDVRDKEEAQKHMLAFSYGLHTSLVVSRLEDFYDREVQHLKEIPEEIVKPYLLKIFDFRNRRDVKHRIRQLLKLRGELNLHNQLLDHFPDLFWEEPQLENSFRQISRHLEISNRIKVLNQRIDYCTECVETLRTQLHEEYSFRLEWMIIILITFEVLQTLFGPHKITEIVSKEEKQEEAK